MDHINILCVNLNGLERLSTILIEPPEEFKALETHVVDIAAQQVQREVQHIANERDDYKAYHISGDRTQRVEHLGNDGTGEHQSHQTRIGQNIGKISGNVIVQGAADTNQLSADALLAIT